jgi:hypothetical protein
MLSRFGLIDPTSFHRAVAVFVSPCGPTPDAYRTQALAMDLLDRLSVKDLGTRYPTYYGEAWIKAIAAGEYRRRLADWVEYSDKVLKTTFYVDEKLWKLELEVRAAPDARSRLP